MHRPTALIRRLLVAEAVQEYMSREIASIKEQMRRENVKILAREQHVQDIWIQYRCGTTYEEAIFMKKMLDAESRSRARRTGMLES